VRKKKQRLANPYRLTALNRGQRLDLHIGDALSVSNRRRRVKYGPLSGTIRLEFTGYWTKVWKRTEKIWHKAGQLRLIK
jgi:hypothetical protein